MFFSSDVVDKVFIGIGGLFSDEVLGKEILCEGHGLVLFLEP